MKCKLWSDITTFTLCLKLFNLNYIYVDIINPKYSCFAENTVILDATYSEVQSKIVFRLDCFVIDFILVKFMIHQTVSALKYFCIT